MFTQIKNPVIFFTTAGFLLSYLIYMMVRKRKGERPGSAVREPEL